MRDEIKNKTSEIRQLIEDTEDFFFEKYIFTYDRFKAEMEEIEENLALIENSIETIPDESLERVNENLNTIKETIDEIIETYDEKKLYISPSKQEELDVNAYLDSIETIPDETPTEVLPTEFVEEYVEAAKEDKNVEVQPEVVEVLPETVNDQPDFIEVPPVEIPTAETPANDSQINVEPVQLVQPIEPPKEVLPTGTIDLGSIDSIAQNIETENNNIPQSDFIDLNQPTVQENNTPEQQTVQEETVLEQPIDQANIAFPQETTEINVQELDDLFNS